MNESCHTHLVRVEVGIKYDNGICAVQVNSNTSRPSREHIDENI